jgi:hypothetical protein
MLGGSRLTKLENGDVGIERKRPSTGMKRKSGPKAYEPKETT